MSHVNDTSNQTTNDITSRSNCQSRTASSISGVGESAAKKLRFNEHGLPIGKNSTKSSSRLGRLARTHIPISYSTWPDVPPRFKDQFWNAYKGEFLNIKECQRDIFMKKACNAWKKLKGRLREKLVGDDVMKWKEQVSNNIRSEDWEAYCDHEATQAQKDLRKRNKSIKDNCERKSTHNIGRNGYARAAENWKNKYGRPPTRVELWLATHKTKDGSYAPYDKEFAVFKEKGEEETLDSGPLYETFGKETGGRVRCIGSIISRKAILASAFAREMLEEVNTKRGNLIESVENLREEMESVKSTLTNFIKDFESGKFAMGHNAQTTISSSNTTLSSVHQAPSTSQFSSLGDVISCEILSYTGEVVGYGRKSKLGVVASVHGRQLRTREVRVILDDIIVLDYLLWGGKQGPCSTLADVGKGGIMYWHDDFLRRRDDVH